MADQWGLSTSLPDSVIFKGKLGNATAVVDSILAKIDPEAVVTKLPITTMATISVHIHFSRLRLLPGFILAWQTVRTAGQTVDLCCQAPRTVTLAEDRLAVQECHYAHEGADVDSLCPHCLTAKHQLQVLPAPPGEDSQQFWCQNCRSLSTRLALYEATPCPIPPHIWNNCRRIPPGHPPVLSVPITQLELEVYVSQLPLGKQPGDDDIPNEFLRSAPSQDVADTMGAGQVSGPSLQNILLACVNEILCKGRMPHSWKGARTKLLLKNTQ